MTRRMLELPPARSGGALIEDDVAAIAALLQDR